MKIFVAGSRGIPHIPGGVETHCQALYPEIAKLGYDVTIATRQPYVTQSIPSWKSVHLHHISCPQKKSLEAIAHTIKCIFAAKKLKADILHIHAIGPSTMIPLARIMGLKVIVTHHGPDYQRQKWGAFARIVLRFGEFCAAKMSHTLIVISKVIQNDIYRQYKRKTIVIPNGMPKPRRVNEKDFLVQSGIPPKNYILCVARFVPEKGLDLLIDAYLELQPDAHLVIAGDADHPTPYSKSIWESVRRSDKIHLTGYITGNNLTQIFQNASLFALPSYHEGLPFALLEALSYRLPVIVSDIPPHKEIDLPELCYFKKGNVESLVARLRSFLQDNNKIPLPDFENLAKQYKWESIAYQTINEYQRILNAK